MRHVMCKNSYPKIQKVPAYPQWPTSFCQDCSNIKRAWSAARVF